MKKCHLRCILWATHIRSPARPGSLQSVDRALPMGSPKYKKAAKVSPRGRTLGRGDWVWDRAGQVKGMVQDSACEYAFPGATQKFAYLIRWEDGRVEALSKTAFHHGQRYEEANRGHSSVERSSDRTPAGSKHLIPL